jgi:hypothetical protein
VNNFGLGQEIGDSEGPEPAIVKNPGRATDLNHLGLLAWVSVIEQAYQSSSFLYEECNDRSALIRWCWPQSLEASKQVYHLGVIRKPGLQVDALAEAERSETRLL